MSKYTPKHPSSGASDAAKADGDNKKQKILVIVILAVLAVIIVVGLIFIFVPGAGSGGGKADGGYVPETQDGTTIITPYYDNGILPTSGSRHDVAVIDGGGSSADELTGTWDLDGTTIYLFDGQGRGVMLTGVDNYTFLYSAQDGKLCVDMDFDGGTDREYAYSISDDRLTLDGDGYHFEFTKTVEQ